MARRTCEQMLRQRSSKIEWRKSPLSYEFIELQILQAQRMSGKWAQTRHRGLRVDGGFGPLMINGSEAGSKLAKWACSTGVSQGRCKAMPTLARP